VLLSLGLFDAAVLGDEEAGHTRPGIVHRLDKGTSGVLVVARTGEARERLKAQFQAHSMGREYVALCVGVVEAATIATLHGRHPTDRLRFTTRVTTGKRAVTHVRPLEPLRGATYVACTLETGRTHQIRVHLSERGTPVLGDPVYARPPRDPGLRAVAETLGHQALHARLLAFVHPTTGARLEFEAPLPDDFTTALNALR
jgi:23S rRNA pseudouridine1911/1915/1917 synthase